jgi:hypothetical protein
MWGEVTSQQRFLQNGDSLSLDNSAFGGILFPDL